MQNKIIYPFILALLGLLFSSNIDAHQLSRSFSKWEINNKEVSVTFTVPSRQVTLLPAIEGQSSSLEDLLTKFRS